MTRRNLGTVVSFEVSRTLKKRKFWLSTLTVPFAIALILGLSIISNKTTANKVDVQKNAKFSFEYLDSSGLINTSLAHSLGGSAIADANAGIAKVKSGKIAAFFNYPAKPATQTIFVYGADKGIFDNGKYSAVATQLLQLSVQAKVGDKTLTTLMSGKVTVKSAAYLNGHKSGSFGDVIPPLLFLVIFYLVLLLLGNQMLTSNQEEKENRVTEIILTTLNPTTLILGKIVSLFVIGIVQIVVFASPVLIGYTFFRKDLKLPNLDLSALNFHLAPMLTGLLLLIGGFILFTGTLVAIGAIMPTAKEASNVFGVVMALLFAPFWVISLVASDPSSLIVQVFTYFPYSATVTAMLRNGLGSLSRTTSIIVVSELFLVGFIVLKLAINLFRFGSIEYSKRISLFKVLKKN